MGVGAWFDGADWGALLTPQAPLLEIVARGTVIYLGLFVILRVVLKRESGTVGITDLLVVVLLADAAQNSLAPDSSALPDALLLVGTIVFWAYALNWLGYRSPRFQKILHPPPLPLVEDGKLLRRNMRRELVTEDELLSQIRLQGCDDVSNVAVAYMEGDGRISVIPRAGPEAAEGERAA